MDMSTGAIIARHEALPHPGEYLGWRVGAEEYGVDIRTVREIRRYERPTRVPAAPPWVKGLFNLRGVIVPIVDLRLKFGAARADYTPLTVVIMLSAGDRLVGIVVDAVSEVLDLAAQAIKPPPATGAPAPDIFVTGIASAEGRMVMLVDMARLLGDSLAEAPGP